MNEPRTEAGRRLLAVPYLAGEAETEGVGLAESIVAIEAEAALPREVAEAPSYMIGDHGVATGGNVSVPREAPLSREALAELRLQLDTYTALATTTKNSGNLTPLERTAALGALGEALAERITAILAALPPRQAEPGMDVETLERAARVAEKHAERIKHTSHHDGLGMGWLAGEEVCRDIAERIRAVPARLADTEPPNRLRGSGDSG